MPGVPFEMQAMMTGEIIPRLRKKFDTPSIAHKTILTQGVGESFLAEIISSWESALPPDLKLAYLPQPGIVRLRLTGAGMDEISLRQMIDGEVAKLNTLIPEYIFGYDEDKLEEIVGRLLKEKKATMGTAESCTGGYIAHLLTTIPGSSEYFRGSVVAYANDIKQSLLGVAEESLAMHGAVSEVVAREMAQGVQRVLGVDYAIAVTGIAGPGGGTPEKPVGTTWIAIATPIGLISAHHPFGDNRERNIRRTALQALNLLRKALIAEK
jgi:nicotinamide-nucleotide amidase